MLELYKVGGLSKQVLNTIHYLLLQQTIFQSFFYFSSASRRKQFIYLEHFIVVYPFVGGGSDGYKVKVKMEIY